MNHSTTFNNNTISNVADDIDILYLRLNLLIDHFPVAIITNLILSLITAQLLLDVVASALLYSWLTLTVAIAYIRLTVNKKIKRKLTTPSHSSTNSPKQMKQYETLYAFLLLFSGFLWGGIALLMDNSWSLSQQLLVPLVIAGTMSGATAALISSVRCYSCYVIPMAVLLSYSLHHNEQNLAATMTIIYLGVMLILVKHISSRLSEKLLLKRENTELVSHLTNTNKSQNELVQQLEKNKQFQQHVFDDAGVAMIIVDNSYQIIDANKAACELSGYSKLEMISLSVLDFMHKDDRDASIFELNQLVTGKINQYQSKRRFKNRSGNTLWLHSTVSAVKDNDDNMEYFIVQSQDITQEYKLTQKLTYQTQHDELTGLPNRYAFEKTLKKLLKQQNNAKHVLGYIDLDQFKVINDTCGHNTGDKLLRQVASILNNELRQSDFIARLGGDEFALIAFDCTLDDAVEQFEAILQKLRDFDFIFENQLFNITASIGVVNINAGDTVTSTLMDADSACYAAKDAGRDRLHLFRYDDEILAQRKGMMQWISRVKHALAADNFVLYHQKIVRTNDNGELPHYELLIRMQDEQGNIIPPGMFLPTVEHYGMAGTLDLWVVEHVIKNLNDARAAGRDISGVYGINLSGHSLGDARFYDEIIERIGDNDFTNDNAYICFEITETAAISNISVALDFIRRLRAVGCQFALDDFGSGLSSFAYLKQLDIDYLKIDGMFVKDCLSDPVNLEMIKSINGIGHVMGLETIAEYVENDAIFDQIALLGVDHAQGYWNGPPVPWTI